ncbi:MAG: hypothetical protein HEQ34_02190 [Sphingorhabdus sp.]|uniref:hypothetical protein n=1 Tax=Sphingorhabdus sp. TaxID=1902408 RepID=UPI0025E6AFB8|nr:hypothetical protein [Sphingorhabdus sp.]MCO4090747.1 hypothetical protein [Sphingorhabdus sp.]
MPKNLLKVPNSILQRLTTFDQDDVVAATVKLITRAEIGNYSGLGLSLEGDVVVFPEPQPPRPSAGKYSNANLYGMEKVRKDLPKITKSYGFWAPSWNSGSTHYVSHDREVYIRDIYPPKEVNLSIALVERRGNDFLIKFAIDQVISRRTPDFQQELLYNLNLLQENVGAADIFESATSLADFAKSVKVDWQLLPPGSVDEVVAAMLDGKRPVNAQQQAVMRERIAVMQQLQPEAYITGTDGFLRYFGAKFGDDFVAFENARYGNALYIMYDGWEVLSQKSRIELLAGNGENYDRIEHRPGWIPQLKGRVQDYRRKKRRAENRLI